MIRSQRNQVGHVRARRRQPDAAQPGRQGQGAARRFLHHSWTAEDRAKFGIYMVEPFVEPEGKVAAGQPRYERQGDKVAEVRDLQDAPKPQPNPLDEVKAQLDALTARIAALEAR